METSIFQTRAHCHVLGNRKNSQREDLLRWLRQKHGVTPRFISSSKHSHFNWLLRKKNLEHETYKDNKKLSPLVAEIPWTNNLLIMTVCKTDEAKEFYLEACIENHYSKRELECQIDNMFYERTAISDAKYGSLAKKNKGLSVIEVVLSTQSCLRRR